MQFNIVKYIHVIVQPISRTLCILYCCCCCCQVTSVVSDSVRPHRRQPTRLPRPWDSPGKTTGVGRHFLLQSMKVKRETEVAQSCLTLNDPIFSSFSHKRETEIGEVAQSVSFPATIGCC